MSINDFKSEGWRVVVHEAKEGGYWAEVPAMPGCVSEGDTADEARSNAIEAARGCLESYAAMALEVLSAIQVREKAFA